MKDVLSNLSKLPVFCYAVLDGQPVQIRRGAREPTSTPEVDKDAIESVNASLGVTEAQQKAMVAGVTLGWDMDAADPDTYVQLTDDQKLPSGPFIYQYQTEITVIVTAEAHAEELGAEIARERLRDAVIDLNMMDRYAGIISYGTSDTLDLVESTDPREQ